MRFNYFYTTISHNPFLYDTPKNNNLKRYELTDHLGNVRAVFSDVKLSTASVGVAPYDFEADLLASNNYYAFGSLQPGRTAFPNEYRFGFGGQEKDDEVNEVTGSSYTAEYWQYDSRLGRRWNQDPKPNASISNYAVFANNPIWFSDPLGDTITINLFPSGDDVFNRGSKSLVQNQVDDGYFVVTAHSSSRGIQYIKDGKRMLATTAEEVHNVLKGSSPEYKKAMDDGKNIVLTFYSCNTAAEEYVTPEGVVIKREHTIAEKVSESKPNSTFIAADGYVYYGEKNGKPAIKGVRQTNAANPENTYEGGFITLKNGKKISKKKMAYNTKTGIVKKGPVVEY